MLPVSLARGVSMERMGVSLIWRSMGYGTQLQ